MFSGRIGRLKKEVEEIEDNPSPYWTVKRSDTDENMFNVVFIYSPEPETVVNVNVHLHIPLLWPFHAPRFIFKDKINYEHIHSETGEFILCDGDWTPALTLHKFIMSIYSLIYKHDPILAKAVNQTQVFKMELLSRTIGFET